MLDDWLCMCLCVCRVGRKGKRGLHLGSSLVNKRKVVIHWSLWEEVLVTECR